MNQLYFQNIHLLRGFAALSVVGYHIVELLPWKEFPITPEPILWVRVGWMGVDLFFVISGFVISLSAIRLIREGERPFPQTFIRHRIARITPLYYTSGLLFVLFSPSIIAAPNFSYHLFTHLFFVHNLFTDTHGSINGANWSIGTEMQFYCLILLTAHWLSRTKPWLILSLSLILAWSWRASTYWLLNQGGGGETWPIFVYSTQVVGMLDVFGFGVFLSRFVLDSPQKTPRKGWTQMVSIMLRHGGLWSIAAFCTFLFAWKLYWNEANYWESWEMVVFWRSSLALAFFCIIGTAVFMRLPNWLERWALAPFYYLGEISYGIYLWHILVIIGLKKIGITDPVLFSIFSIALVILFAALSWHFLEQPIIRRFR